MTKNTITLSSLDIEFKRNYLDNYPSLDSDLTVADLKGIDEIKNLIILSFNECGSLPYIAIETLDKAREKLLQLQKIKETNQ